MWLKLPEPWARNWTVAWRIVLPLASPAILLGVILCLMETLNDMGAVTYLGVFTLTHQIENIWLNRNSLGRAAAIAVLLFLIVLVLIVCERAARRGAFLNEERDGGKFPCIPCQFLDGGDGGRVCCA